MHFYALIKNNNKYLLERMPERNGFKYSIPGGHSRTTENGEQCLKRKLIEEDKIPRGYAYILDKYM